MKKQALKIFTTVAFFAVLATAPAYGQSIVGRADIPFDFVIRDEQAAAGRYTVEQVGSSSGIAVLQLRRADGHGIEMFVPMPVQARASADRGKLMFHKYGDRYFLYQVWSAGRTLGYELRKSRRERALRQESARTMAQRQEVMVALNQ